MQEEIYNLISENDFLKVWGAQTSISGDFFNFHEAQKHEDRYVWTVIETGDSSDGNWYAVPGYHIVNKLGYVVTKKPWNNETPDGVYFQDDFDDKKAIKAIRCA